MHAPPLLPTPPTHPQVRTQLTNSRKGGEAISGFNSSTANMLRFYLVNSSGGAGSSSAK